MIRKKIKKKHSDFSSGASETEREKGTRIGEKKSFSKPLRRPLREKSAAVLLSARRKFIILRKRVVGVIK